MSANTVPQLVSAISTGTLLESSKSFDYSYTHDDGIRESFLAFSLRIHELDKHLGKFATEALNLGRVAGLLLAIRTTRTKLRSAREAFFRNAMALHPELYELARKDSGMKSLDTTSEHYFIAPHYFHQALPEFEALPKVLKELAEAFSTIYTRVEEFREFTDEGALLRSLLLTLENDLNYRASCARAYSHRFNTPSIQRYIHQFTEELGSDIEKLTVALRDFTAVGVSAIGREQERSSQNLTSILTVATFFSGVTAGTLGMSTSRTPQTDTLLLTNMLWFASMVFSVGAALNSLLVMVWRGTRSGSRGGKLPFWATLWFRASPMAFLGISIVTFSTGLVVFAYASSQARYTPPVVVAATGVTFIGLVAILIWIVYEELSNPFEKQEANVIRSSRESVHSNASSHHFQTKILGVLSHAFGHQPHIDTGADTESTESVPVEDKTSKQESSSDERQVDKFRKGAREIGLVKTALSAFASPRTPTRRSFPRGLSSPKNQLRINTATSPTPITQLVLPSKPAFAIDLARYGTIRDVSYSDDGRWLAVACARESTGQSWTVVYEKVLTPDGRLDEQKSTIAVADTWHQGRVVSERLVWSPSGKKLIVKFEHRFDVWDIVPGTLTMVERHHSVSDVRWCGDDAFFVAEHSCIFKLNLMREMAVYRFDDMHVRSVAFERKNNYLIVVARVTKSSDDYDQCWEPASSRSEKQIVVYDMDKREVVYRVPVLENILNVTLGVDELDMLVTHKDQKAFQLWSLDAGFRGTEIAPRLKRRAFTPHPSQEEYVGPTCLGGNSDQFVLSATSSGAIDIWLRESGKPSKRFEAQLFKDEGLHSFSWSRSSDRSAVFTTVGVGSSVVSLWQGEEQALMSSPESETVPTNRGRLQHAAQLAAVLSLSPAQPREMEKVDESFLGKDNDSEASPP